MKWLTALAWRLSLMTIGLTWWSLRTAEALGARIAANRFSGGLTLELELSLVVVAARLSIEVVPHKPFLVGVDIHQGA